MAASRRSSGESSIYKDVAGRWHGYVSMGLKKDGVRDRRHVSGSRRTAVVAKVRALETKRDAGTAAAAGKVQSVEQWLDHWCTTIAAVRVRPRTQESYRSIIDHHLNPNLGHHRLDRLQPEHLEKLYADLSGTLAAGTVLRVHRVLSRALKVAMQRDLIARNVATLVDPPSVRRVEVEPLSRQDARQILETAQAGGGAARWSVALALGLRQSEALGLGWSDVDLEKGMLTVRRGLHRVKGAGLVFEEPKSATSKRAIALPRQMVEQLRSHRSEQLKQRLATGSIWEDHGLVFVQANGRPIDRRADHRAWQALLAKSGVRAARLHDARHTAATLLLVQGVAPRVVMGMLGHSTMRVTTDTYQHVVPELATEAAEQMGNALWGT
jgi:integrase